MPSESVPDHERSPFRLDRCPDPVPLRRALEEAGYTESSISKTVLMDDSGQPMDLAAVLHRTAAASPYNTLIRLFVLGRPVSEEAVRNALAPAGLEELAAPGLIKLEEEHVRAEAALIPYGDLILLRDFWPSFLGQPAAKNHVPGVGQASQAVANMTVRMQVESALDLGTGMGYQAIRAARHADRVMGTDTNPRALNFAAINARLNDLTGIEFRRGSLYEPVAECRFDLIVSNPPFVISPRADHEYRDGSLSGDAFSEQVICGAPEFLREGGYCTILFNWYHQNEDDWADRPTKWVKSGGCDAWIVRFDTVDPINYASSWLDHVRDDEPEHYDRLLDEWLAYYDRLGIGLISLGAVVLRRRSGPSNWIRAEEEPAQQPSSSSSDQIRRIFANQDLLEKLDADTDLLDNSFALAPGHQLEQVLKAKEGRWNVEGAQLKQTRGIPFVGNVDRLISTVLAGCDGTHPLRELVDDLATGLNMESEQIAPACTLVIRRLLESGFLTVSTDAE